MADYRDIGPTQPVTGVIDNSGANPYGNGNWAVTVDTSVQGFRVAQFEMYQAQVDGGPVGFKFQVRRGVARFNTVLQGWDNTYDPQQPLILHAGDVISFYWNSGAAPAPVVTCWFRYDTALPENQ